MKLSTVEISLVAYSKMLHHSTSNIEREVIGLLIGKIKEETVQVIDVQSGPQSGTRVSAELSPEIQAHVAEALIKRGSELYIVGWYHSHPGIGVFMSGTDVDTQGAYQAVCANSVAIVIDPIKYADSKNPMHAELGVFRVNQNRPEKLQYRFATDVTTTIDDVMRHLDQSEDSLEKMLNLSDAVKKSIARELRNEKVTPASSSLASFLLYVIVAELGLVILLLLAIILGGHILGYIQSLL